MGTVILRKRDETKKIPFLLFKIFSVKDGVFNDDIYDITFLNCKFNSYGRFELAKHQTIKFLNCDFKNNFFEVFGGNVYIDDTCIGIGSLELCCNSVYLKNINETNRSRKLSNLSIVANDVEILGNIEVRDRFIVNAGNLNIKDTEILAKDIDLASIKLSIKNSLFESSRDNLSFSYKFLYMKDVSFFNKKGNVEFFDIVDGDFKTNFYRKLVVSYKNPGSLTDSDILEDRSVYSFLSILKGYRNKINSINDKDVRDAIAEMDSNINKKIKKLEAEKQELITIMQNSKKEIENNLSNRKVKSLRKG